MAGHREFIVDVAPLRRAPGTVIHEDRRGVLEGLRISECSVPAGAPVSIAADLAWASSDVVVTATVRAPWVGECRRCCGPAAGDVVAEVREVYAPGSDGEETYRLTGSRVDLEPLVRDAVLLGLPPAPLCEEGCLGLCSTCGANRNEGPCGCDTSLTDPRWAALGALQTTDQADPQ